MFRSESITEKIMTEISSKVKDFISDTIRHSKEIDFGQIEKEVSDLSKHFSQLVASSALEAIGTGYVGRCIECECGGVLEYHSNRSWGLKSLNGELEIERAYYYCKRCKSSKIPLDEQLGLEGKHQSIGVRRLMALEGMMQPFEETEKIMEEIGIDVSSKEIQLESEEIGEEVYIQKEEEEESLWTGEAEIKAERRPSRLYITADGTTVRTSDGNKEVKLGSVYETADVTGALASEIRYIGGFCDSEGFGKRLYVLASKRGYEEAKEVIFLGDGAKWIWSIVGYHFPRAVQILDWYHAEERIWGVGKAIYGEGSEEAEGWVREQLEYLSRGEAESVINSMKKLISSKSSSDKEVVEKIEENITYFENNKSRMRYSEYKARGYHIGSGTAESGCKHVIGQRLKQSGMTWSIKGAEAILQLRILWKNGEWDRFWQTRKVAA